LKTGGRVYTLERARARIFLNRGKKLLEMVEKARELHNYDGMATVGVQAAIAFADAYTVSELQQRSRGQDHAEVVRLIRLSRAVDSSEIAGLVQRVLNRKTDVQYGDRPVRPSDAESISADVKRISQLVSAAVG